MRYFLVFRNLIIFFGVFAFCLDAFAKFAFGVDETESYKYLDGLAEKYGTDKGSSGHNYTMVYAKYFSPIKEARFKFLEIGIWKGSSVRLWESYFPNAELHFIDINPDIIEYHSTRSAYHFVDQSNGPALTRLAESLGGISISSSMMGGIPWASRSEAFTAFSHTLTQEESILLKIFIHLTGESTVVMERLENLWLDQEPVRPFYKSSLMI